MKELIELFHRLCRLNIDLQHLVVLTFPRTQTYNALYLYLSRHDVGVFSSKLKDHQTYSKSISEHLDSPSRVFYEDGRVLYQEWRHNGVFHREGDLPALIEYFDDDDDNKVLNQVWYKNGKKHRENDKPARILYFKNNQKQIQVWCKDGKIHRDPEGDLPAYIIKYKDGRMNAEWWYKNGELHRDNGAANIVYMNGEVYGQEFWNNGIRV